MTLPNMEKFEVKEYECNESYCNGVNEGFGNVGLFLLLLPSAIAFIF